MNRLPALFGLACILLFVSASGQSSLCSNWERLMELRSENFVPVSGDVIRKEGRETIYQGTLSLSKDWDEITIRAYPDYNARQLEARKKNLTDVNMAYNWLNEQLSKLAACLPNYGFFKYPAAVDKYYIAPPEGKEDRHASAIIGYNRATNGTYEVYFFLEKFYEILADNAVLAPIKPAALPKPPPPPGDYKIGNVFIKKAEFSKKLLQLLELSKSSFSAIRGPEEKGKVFTTFKTSLLLDGADSLFLTYLPSGMVYNAIYLRSPSSTAAFESFEDLRELVSLTLPSAFASKGIVNDDFGRKITFVNKSERTVVTIEKPDESHELLLSVAQPKFLPD